MDTALPAAPLPRRAQVLYAASSFGSEALTQSRSLWLLYFYTEATDVLSTFSVGLILTVGRLVEMLDDGVIGYWSDRTRSTLGRRIPFVLAATPFWALFGFLLFTPPQSSAAAAAAYLFIVMELYFLFSTLSGGPYEALLPEIARTSDDRVAVVSKKVWFGTAGGGLGLIVSGLIEDVAGFVAMGATFAVLALSFRYLGLAGVWHHASRTQEPAELGFVDAFRTTFSNRAFLAFLPTFALFQVAFQLLIGSLPFVVKAALDVEEEGRWVAGLSAVAFVTVALSIPLFAWFGRRTSKRHSYRAAMLLAAVTFPLLGVLGYLPGIPGAAQLVLAMALVGAPIAGNYLFPAPLIADIVDDDELRTGMRREGTYFGSQNFVEKTTSAFVPLILAGLLSLGQTTDDPLGLRLVGPVAGVLVLVAWIGFRRYTLPDDVRAGRDEGG